MNKATRFAVYVGTAAMLASVASQSHAQLSGLRKALPGASHSTASTPDAFLSETIQTTKLVMSSAAMLAAAASENPNKDALKAEITAIEAASTPGDLQGQKAQFDANIASINQNAADADRLQAVYDQADAKQKELMMHAAYNFTIGMLRNGQLSQEAPDVIRGVGASPLNAGKLGALRASAGLLGDQVQATRSMIGPMRSLLSKGGVEIPASPSVSDAKPVTDDLFN